MITEPSFKDSALEILNVIDYDMWKEAKAEPEEWDDVLSDVSDILRGIFYDGYALCEVDHGLDQP